MAAGAASSEERPDGPATSPPPGESGLPDPRPDTRTEGGEGGVSKPATPGAPPVPESGGADGAEDREAAPGEARRGEPGLDEAQLEEAARAVVEDVSELAAVAAERDEYLDALRRLQADFANFRKRVDRQQAETSERAAEHLVGKLLDVLDAAEMAVRHDGSEAVMQLAGKLHEVLAKEGLDPLYPEGQPFDPAEHDAVMHEAGDGPAEVLEVLRTGYRWKGRVLRPAMVKVKGS